MRHYLSESNLVRALALSAVCTLMSVPRIVQGGLNPWGYVPAAFVSLVLVGGAATAWSHRAGMAGLWPGSGLRRQGIAVAAAAGLILVPLALWLDPTVKAAFAAGGNSRAVLLQFPDTAPGVAALILWSASFELVFFVAASAAFFARLFNRKWVAVLGPVAVRVAVARYQLAAGNVTDSVPLILAEVGIYTAAACLLFVRFGLPAPAALIAILEARLFLGR